MKYALLLALLLQGCAATIIKPVTSAPAEYAPIEKEAAIGTIEYLNEGAEMVREYRRKDAYKQMFIACGGRYKLLGQKQITKGDASSAMIGDSNRGFSTFGFTPNYIRFEFECVK